MTTGDTAEEQVSVEDRLRQAEKAVAVLTQQVEVLQRDSAHYAELLTSFSEALERLESTVQGIRDRTTPEALRTLVGEAITATRPSLEQAIVAAVMEEHRTRWGSHH